jgi:hypothetical protein
LVRPRESVQDMFTVLASFMPVYSKSNDSDKFLIYIIKIYYPSATGKALRVSLFRYRSRSGEIALQNRKPGLQFMRPEGFLFSVVGVKKVKKKYRRYG